MVAERTWNLTTSFRLLKAVATQSEISNCCVSVVIGEKGNPFRDQAPSVETSHGEMLYLAVGPIFSPQTVIPSAARNLLVKPTPDAVLRLYSG